jgi:hypothetical protein
LSDSLHLTRVQPDANGTLGTKVRITATDPNDVTTTLAN